MPTTDPSIAAAVLDSLREAGTDFALLQSSTALRSSAPTSDIDVVVGTTPVAALRLAQHALETHGVCLATIWPYDVGGAATAFFFDQDGLGGAQVDMLYDPQGIGHYSVRSTELLGASNGGTRFPTVSNPELSVYMFSKRLRKQQPQGLEAARLVLARLTDVERAELVTRMVTSPTLARAILGCKRPQIAAKARPRVIQARVTRMLSRLKHPVGFWVHLPGDREDLAGSIARQFGQVLVHDSVSRYPTAPAAAWAWFVRHVQPIRLRPGLVTSWGPRPVLRGPTPDLTINDTEREDAVTRLIVAAMADRHRAG